MKAAAFFLHHRIVVLVVFCVAAVICLLLQPLVAVNYDITDYLPPDAPSTVALEVLEREFSAATPNARVMVPGVTIPEALEVKQKLAAAPGVESILWLDDVLNVYEPLELADEELVSEWYRDETALFSLTVDAASAVAFTEAAREIVGLDGALAGTVVDQASAQFAAEKEVRQVMIYFLPLILLILFIATRSWLEPLFFLATMGIAILLNMGTNIVFGSISFITATVTPVLQLAVSMDYAIFLLTRYNQYRQEGHDAFQAMQLAMSKAAPAVMGSALTTLFGFLALTLMNFRVGADMGIVLAKGIVFSLLTVMLFLPALTLAFCRLHDKTAHRPFLPGFAGWGSFITRRGVPFLLVVIFLIGPAFLAQKNNNFTYGTAGLDQSGRAAADARRIEETFGKANYLVLLLPREKWGHEQELVEQIAALAAVADVTSYVNTVGAEIPPEYLEGPVREQFFSENYSRIVIHSATDDESKTAFQVVESIKKLAKSFYDEYYLAGTSASIYDIQETVTADSIVVNGVAILAIGIVLLFVFRSLSLPLILLLTIEGAIWINLALPYFLGTTLNYVGYLIISSVQLGATVDYGILFTQHYLDNRKLLADKKQAAAKTVAETAGAILTPALILCLGGLTLYAVSTNSIVTELGLVLGRGAALSAAMVLVFLPNLLLVTDRLVRKTTLVSNFKRME
ncbi:MAG: MMPL family transporter [Firmicutes bacterium]|jgi:predicted RND superfamily exporter protein|nr:MMPL family transporter [Bacillota bacterium]